MKHPKEIIAKHPTTMTARKLRADQPIVVPDPPKKPDGTIDSTFQLRHAKYDLAVFAVATDTSMKLMKDFIKEFNTPWITVDGPRSYVKQHFTTLYHADTTPTIYVLDDRNIIIAKKLPVKQLDDFLSRHEKFQEIKKRGAPK